MLDDAQVDRMRLFLERYGCADLPVEDFAIALTHRSHAYEAGIAHDNERLEFLGDALISAVASEMLFANEPSASEGALSKQRARLVSRAALGRRAEEMGLGEIVLLGRGERETGGARRRSLLGSALEAVAGIVYLKLGGARCRLFISEHILRSLMETLDLAADTLDFKSALQEWTQERLRMVPVYVVLNEVGPDHDKQFTVQVELNGKILATGQGRRIKAAENDAARNAMKLLTENPEFIA